MDIYRNEIVEWYVILETLVDFRNYTIIWFSRHPAAQCGHCISCIRHTRFLQTSTRSCAFIKHTAHNLELFVVGAVIYDPGRPITVWHSRLLSQSS